MNSLHQSMTANLPPVFLRNDFEFRKEDPKVKDVADLQRAQVGVRQLGTRTLAVFRNVFNWNTNPYIVAVRKELDEVWEEERREEIPITPVAFTTAVTVLTFAFAEIDAPVPMPAIAPDGRGGIRIEWARGDRNVRAVIPARADQRSFIYHIVGGISKLDRLSGTNLAMRLREVIL